MRGTRGCQQDSGAAHCPPCPQSSQTQRAWQWALWLGTENPLDLEDIALPSWESPRVGAIWVQFTSITCLLNSHRVCDQLALLSSAHVPTALLACGALSEPTRHSHTGLPQSQLPQDPGRAEAKMAVTAQVQTKVALCSALTPSPLVYTAPISVQQHPPPLPVVRTQCFQGSPIGHWPGLSAPPPWHPQCTTCAFHFLQQHQRQDASVFH